MLGLRRHHLPAWSTVYREGFHHIIIQGYLEELKFMNFYTKSEVIDTANMNYDSLVSKVAEVLASGSAIQKQKVETGMSWLRGKGS